MTLLEAMSIGVPSICMSSCGIADLLARAGAAKIARTDDVDSLVSAIRELLDAPDNAYTLGMAGRTAVRDHFSIEAVVDELESLYAGQLR
jgi:glycosyltransferase involved in cell wall biosynthesis